MNFDDDKEDYFDDVERPVPPKKPHEPALTPDDPKYWEAEESEFEHLIPANPGRKKLVWFWSGCALVVGALLMFVWLRYFSPYVDQAAQYGYVNHIERRGTIFKTYEGEFLPFRNVLDTTRVDTTTVNRADLQFTATPKVAARLREFYFSNRPVRVTYRKYHTTLPWRGDSKTVIIGVDSVDPHNLVPLYE